MLTGHSPTASLIPMKAKLIISMCLILPACTTVRKDDHSYTYIHNYNNNTDDSSGSKKVKLKRESNNDDEPVADETPIYNRGLRRTSTSMNDEQFLQYQQAETPQVLPPANVTYNHYYAANTPKRPTYHVPPSYSGFTPSVRRFLVYGDIR